MALQKRLAEVHVLNHRDLRVPPQCQTPHVKQDLIKGIISHHWGVGVPLP